MKQDMIVILDLGSTENTVLARAIRALGVYSEIYPHDITAAELKALPNVKGVIINGGPNHVIDGVDIDVLPEIYKAGVPVMAAGHDKACCEVKLPQLTDDVEAIKNAVQSFVFDTCKAEANWNMTNFVNDQIELIRVNSRNAATTPSFEQVREEIRARLLQEKQQAAYTSKINQLRIRFPVDRL